MDAFKTPSLHTSTFRKRKELPFLKTPRKSVVRKFRRNKSQSPLKSTPIASPRRVQITPPRNRRRYLPHLHQFESDRFIGRRWTNLERNGFNTLSPEHHTSSKFSNSHSECYRQMLKHELLFGHQMEPELDDKDECDTEDTLCTQYHGECEMRKYFDFNKGSSPISDRDRLSSTPTSSPINVTKTRRKLQFESDRRTESESGNPWIHSMSTTPLDVDTQCKIANLRNKSKLRVRRQSESDDLDSISENEPFRVLDAPEIVDDFYSSIMDWNHNRNLIAIGLTDDLYLYHPEYQKTTHLKDGQRRNRYSMITAVKMAPSGHEVAVGNDNGTVTVWNIEKERVIQRIETKEGGQRHLGVLEWSQHWNCIFTASKMDGTVHIVDERVCPHSVSTMSTPTKSVSLKWSPDSTKFAIGGRDRCVSIYDIRSLRSRVFKLSFHSSSIRAISWSPHNHNVLVSGGGALDKKLCLWNLNAVRPFKAEQSYLDLDCITIHRPVKWFKADSQICDVVWNPLRREEVVTTHGFDSNDIKTWDLERGQITNTMDGHRRRVLFMAMAPNQRDIVTASSDERLKFWKVFGRKKRTEIEGDDDVAQREEVIR